MHLRNKWRPSSVQVQMARDASATADALLIVGNPYLFFPRYMQPPDLDGIVLDIHDPPECYERCASLLGQPGLECRVCRIFFPNVDAEAS